MPLLTQIVSIISRESKRFARQLAASVVGLLGNQQTSLQPEGQQTSLQQEGQQTSLQQEDQQTSLQPDIQQTSLQQENLIPVIGRCAQGTVIHSISLITISRLIFTLIPLRNARNTAKIRAPRNAMASNLALMQQEWSVRVHP